MRKASRAATLLLNDHHLSALGLFDKIDFATSMVAHDASARLVHIIKPRLDELSLRMHEMK
eukprot:scaffold312443_cov32-Tisochrysis_lutea.AAC.1